MLEPRVLLTAVTSVDPPANSQSVSPSMNISATFDQDINAGTATPQNFVVHATLRPRTVTVSATGDSVTADPTFNFLPGELVQVTATAGIQSANADPVVPHVWQFRTRVPGGLGTFTNTGQLIGDPENNAHTVAVALGDLDGDGDLDALSANSYQRAGAALGSRVYLNDGTAVFTDSGQVIGTNGGVEVDLGDVDGDGDLDAFVSRYEANRLYFNNGAGVFTDSGASIGSGITRATKFADLDGDGDLDAFSVNNGPNVVWRNDGNGGFAQAQSLGSQNSRGVALGDVDNDGDIDAFVANEDRGRDNTRVEPNRLWLNDGTGSFSDSGQALGDYLTKRAFMVVLGDIDGDGDLDAWTGGRDYQNRLFLNDGAGIFTEGGQSFQTFPNTGWTYSGEFGDFDADGDLDILDVRRYTSFNRVWTNNGSGVFTWGDIGGRRNTPDAAVGDLDGDGDLDFYITGGASADSDNSAARVWTNNNPPVSVAIVVDDTTISENSGAATITATVTGTAAQDLVVNLDFSGTATGGGVDYTATGSAITIPRGSTTGSMSVTAVQDTLDEVDETIIVDIGRITGGATGTGEITISIIDDDDPPAVSLAINDVNISENGGAATATAMLSTASGQDVTVDLTAGGTATLGIDYNLSSTRIVIAAGATTGTATVTAIDDAVDEPNETVILEITAVTGATEDGEQSQTVTIDDDDLPPTFSVTSLVATSTGFIAEFNADLDASRLNIYDTQSAGLGPADVVLEGATSGEVPGSLIIDSSRSIAFTKTGGPLEPDTYTVVMRSASDGFKDVDGRLLDGDGDGAAGDSFITSFTVAELAANSIAVGLADFVRGPGQDVNLPADATTGIPLSISEGTNVRAIDLQISYDPAMLDITSATVGANMPAGASVIANTNTPGLLILVFFSATALPAGSSNFVDLRASVPNTDSGGIYGKQQVIDVHSVTISDGNDNEFPVVVDDAVQLASYLADVSGNGRINASDAAQVARVAALLDGGFSSTLLTDPRIIGDISGNGRINAADASLIARFAAQIDVPEIPSIPNAITESAGADAVWMDSSPLLHRQWEAPVEAATQLNEWSTSGFGWSRFPDHHAAAVDVLMAEGWKSSVGAMGEKSSVVLEEAIDELFGGLSADVLLAR